MSNIYKTEQYSNIENLMSDIVAQVYEVNDNKSILQCLPFTYGCSCPSHIERDLQKVLDLLKDINSTIDVLHATTI